MKQKYVIGIVLILAISGWLMFTANEWGTHTIGYQNLSEAKSNGKISYVKGYWVKDKPIAIEAQYFSFYMEDDFGTVSKVVYPKGKPNNFENSSSIVVQGSFQQDGIFHAKTILIKCPSKYQSETKDAEKTT